MACINYSESIGRSTEFGASKKAERWPLMAKPKVVGLTLACANKYGHVPWDDLDA